MFIKAVEQSSKAFDIKENKKQLKENKLNAIKKYTLSKDSFLRSSKCNEQTVLGTTIGNTQDKATSPFDKFVSRWFPRFGKPTLNPIEEWLLSDNKCTDKKNDGKISFLSKVVNVAEGAGKAFAGTLYNILTNPKRLAKTLITGFVLATLASNPITAVPVAALGLLTGVNLVGNGVKTILNSSKEAKNAKKDSVAKDAYEKIGQGLLEIGAGTLSNVQSFKLLKMNVPQIKPASAKFVARFKEFLTSPKKWFENAKSTQVKIDVKNVEKTAVETLLDVCNIEDDI